MKSDPNDTVFVICVLVGTCILMGSFVFVWGFYPTIERDNKKSECINAGGVWMDDGSIHATAGKIGICVGADQCKIYHCYKKEGGIEDVLE